MLKTGSGAEREPTASGAARSEANDLAPNVPLSDDQLRAITIGEPTRPSGRIAIVDYDAAWPRLFVREGERVRATLGERVLLLEHVGSTSVPGLAAKPCIDMLLVVEDSANEAAYAPDLEAAGYALRIREPDWYEHRMFRRSEPSAHLHVFSPNCPEAERMLLFRDRLRGNEADRRLYERTKRELARREWTYMQNYADAKSAVVMEIIVRARQDYGNDSAHRRA